MQRRTTLCISSGGAGVSKFVLIKALYQSLYRFLNLREGENPDDIRVLLCAYTGKAAYNINGVTIASAFLKYTRCVNYFPLNYK